MATSQKRRPGGQPKTDFIPFPEASASDGDVVLWFLMHAYVDANKSTYNVRCDTSQANAELATRWFEKKSGISVSVGDNGGLQVSLRLGVAGKKWLSAKAVELVDPDVYRATRFYISCSIAEEKQQRFVDAVERARQLCLENCYKRQGRRGCVDCGSELNLHFDHINPLLKNTHVSKLLKEGKFEQALVEAKLTVARCWAHHIEKSIANGDHGHGRPRAPVGDAQTEQKRAKSREANATRAEKGRRRDNDAKLSAGKCHRCKKSCTIDTLHDFQWNHRDLKSKRYNMSRLIMSSDKTYFTELAKCDLLCVDCHYAVTKEQWNSGELSLLFRENRAKRRAEAEEEGEEQEDEENEEVDDMDMQGE